MSSILVDRHGRVWCGTFGGGVSRLENGRFTVFGRRNGLPDEYVTSLLRDAEDEIWIDRRFRKETRFLLKVHRAAQSKRSWSESQVREHHMQLQKRLDSIRRIHRELGIA